MKYEQFVQEMKNEQIETPNVKRTIWQSKGQLVLTTFILLLLILPILTMVTFLYYGKGAKSAELMEVAVQSTYVTTPNAHTHPMEIDLSFQPLSMRLEMEEWKVIGREEYPVKTHTFQYVLGHLQKVETQSRLERQMKTKYTNEWRSWLAHPKGRVPFHSDEEWQKVSGLPEGTVIEAYLSLRSVQPVQEVLQQFPEVSVRWAAIDTGVEETMTSKEGDWLLPLGYPVQKDTTNWSPFKDEKDHEAVFRRILTFLTPYEQQVAQMTGEKTLALAERLVYVQKQEELQTYGVVVTGSKQSIEALQQHPLIKEMKVGEVKLWNWHE